MNKADVCECVLEVVREVSKDESVSYETKISNIMIDSIGWMRCLASVEKRLGCAIDPKVFFSSSTDIKELCDSLLNYFNLL